MWSLTSSLPIIHAPHHHGHPHAMPPPTTGGTGDSGGNRPGPADMDDEMEATNSSILHCVLAGGFGGAIGDTSMHSLDTVKTRQQGAPNVAKYKNMLAAYRTIFVEEGIFRGLYGGYSAAMLGSFPSAAIFFGTYEFSKRKLINEWGFNDTLTHLFAGFFGDLVSSFIYVPSEVLKTRLQLQGRYNNPHFDSGYNYKNLRDCIGTVVKTEGPAALLFGYKATLARDLPFSALQLAFYEKFRQAAFKLEAKQIGQDQLSIMSELSTGALAGGVAGVLTTPLDVIKTRVQTQQTSPASELGKPANLSSSLFSSLRIVYKSEGLIGFFSGVGPRFIWTSIQSSIMLFLYQYTLRGLNTVCPSNNGLA
ncbi:hypothetical protein ZYGR_0AF02250 [Zygosaccharomyces rouxii]|uniref:Mitochondrial carrier protein n=1 Tax=Zygosaccharomyces rouxii TaxID=4956 RepID=A0A1Q3A7Q6_ZYGRO|nr:hypothetical protein ZYGR_0AF02250 [Zygosaccharomyces rouxii]